MDAKTELYIMQLEDELDQARNTIGFLHGCLTQPNYSYDYPEQTLKHLKDIDKLIPPRKWCIHSRRTIECESCVETLKRQGRKQALEYAVAYAAKFGE